jgi:tRNA G10  N-methylase Trm11
MIQLFQGDSLKILQELPGGSVDAVITDPPYSSGGAFRTDRVQGTVRSTYRQARSSSGPTLQAITEIKGRTCYGAPFGWVSVCEWRNPVRSSVCSPIGGSYP